MEEKSSITTIWSQLRGVLLMPWCNLDDTVWHIFKDLRFLPCKTSHSEAGLWLNYKRECVWIRQLVSEGKQCYRESEREKHNLICWLRQRGNVLQQKCITVNHRAAFLSLWYLSFLCFVVYEFCGSAIGLLAQSLLFSDALEMQQDCAKQTFSYWFSLCPLDYLVQLSCSTVWAADIQGHRQLFNIIWVYMRI